MQSKRDKHSYAQNARYLVSCIGQNPINKNTQVTVLIKDLTNDPVKTYLFHLNFESLDEAIAAAEQKNFDWQQAHVHFGANLPSIRQKEQFQNLWLSPM